MEATLSSGTKQELRRSIQGYGDVTETDGPNVNYRPNFNYSIPPKDNDLSSKSQLPKEFKGKRRHGGNHHAVPQQEGDDSRIS